ncbi:hypothetical protein L1049_005901 [Liquidambar formosana]|uniref:Uncharacterized protein n=1 Tax=Liquidambar formosana TaxID=63359 RepID=A0AAP0WSI7_LIQFO
MAPSSSSKSINLSCYLLNLLLLLLLIGSCTATRPVKMAMVNRVSTNTEHLKPHPRKHEANSRYHGQVFNYFPKGTPIPPSGPSKRHNSVVDSTPRN